MSPVGLEDLPWLSFESLNCYLCDPNGKEPSKIKKGNALWLIGPEGGWSEKEQEYLTQKGCKKICLSKTVLRMETAAICAIFWGAL